MRVLVTGGAGFIGSHLVDAYVRRGDDVAVLDNFVTGRRENLNPNAQVFELDLADREAVERCIQDYRPELINHHAAHLSIQRSVADPWHDAKTNILGFLNLVEPAVKVGLKRLVVASSGGAMYGDDAPRPTPETVTPQPVSPYGVSKLTMESYLHYYGVQHQLPWVALRYANVYGPRQNPSGETGVVAVFFGQMGDGGQPTINGDGAQTRDYVFIDDVVAANLAASVQGQGCYNIGTGSEVSVTQIFNAIQHELGTHFPERHGPARAGEQRHSALDSAKAAFELDWKPTVDFASGIAQTAAWYKEWHENPGH